MGVPSRSIAAGAIALCVAVAGCGKGLPGQAAESGSGPVAAVGEHGAGGLSTKNTTRLGGSQSAIDAAAVAVAAYPGLTPDTRPRAVVVVDGDDWPAALAASTLAGHPLNAPLIFSDGGTLPEASSQALRSMRPTGTGALGGTGTGVAGRVQVIGVGDVATPAGYVARRVSGSDPAALAVAIERLASTLRKRTPRQVILTAADGPPAMTMPVAGLAAQTGAPILFVDRSRIPRATAVELKRLGRPSMYVVGPDTVVAKSVRKELESFGTVSGIAGVDAASNAISVARFADGTFGWGVVEPGHGLVFANAQRPFDGPAAAPLSATGDYGPLLVVESRERLGSALTAYLSDLQPGTPPSGAVHGVYNHGWVIGDESVISARVQAQLDAILQISSREAAEPAVASQTTPSEPASTTGP
jgi:hypothetical protein